MKDYNKELQELAEKHMPKQLGEALQKRFAELEDKESKLETELKLTKTLSEEKGALITEVTKLKEKNSDLRSKASEVSKKEIEVLAKERDQKVHDAELKAGEAELRVDLATNIVGQVFRSPVFRKSFSTHQQTELETTYNAQGMCETRQIPMGGKTGEETTSEE